MTANKPLTSIIINNYNYGRFLPDAIESALNQTYQPIEVIVVDDGSTDNSRSVIADYGEQIISLCKDNGGMASAFNAGFALSQGKFICFLDSDDILLPNAIERAIEKMDNSNVVKVQWQLCEIDNEGKSLETLIPEKLPPQGDLLPLLIEKGPEAYHFPPTSGNLWSRNYLAQILPMPEAQFVAGADSYLILLAPLFGKIKSLPNYQTLKLVHSQNLLRQKSYRERLERYNFRLDLLQE